MNRREDIRAKMPGILNDILSSYTRTGTLQKVGQYAVPSRTGVAALLEELETILYPGYVGRQDIDAVSIPHYIGERLDSVFWLLSEQIAKSLRHECKTDHTLCDSCVRRGEHQTVEFLAGIPALRDYLADDLDAAFKGDPAAHDLDEVVFCYPGFKAITIYRIAHELYVQSVPILPRMMTECAHAETGIDIHPGATIGRRFFIDHGTGVVIGATTEIGNNVRIYQGVTLGALSVPREADIEVMRTKKRHPTIEDDVTIYAEATVLGPARVGKGSIVGGNVWLTESIPPGSRIMNEPPLLQKGMTKEWRRTKPFTPDFQI